MSRSRLAAERAAALAVAAALFAACAGGGEYRALGAGDPAPAFAAPDLHGDTVSVHEPGAVVLLNVWATWCPPCRDEMPAFEALHREFRDHGLRIVAVSIDAARDDRAVLEFAREHDLTFTILRDAEGRVTRRFRTAGVPETFLIGDDGRILRRWIGAIDPGADDVRRAVRDALSAAPTGPPPRNGRIVNV
jgi:cytochrome c biogenesis protein CcmG, thiol:disulfide interchange protein DsbE